MPRAILDGARFFGPAGQAAMSFARERVIDAFAAAGHVCRITHVCDGTHGDGKGFVLMPSSAPISRKITPRVMANYKTMIRLAAGFIS